MEILFRMVIGMSLVAGVASASLARPPVPENIAADNRAVTPHERTKLLAEIDVQLRKSYVFPEKVAGILADLHRRELAGDYAAISDGAALAERLTQDLRTIGHDRHLGVEFIAQPLPSAAEDEGSRAKAAAKIDRWATRENYGLRKLEILDGNVGYIRIDGFMPAQIAGDAFSSAMRFVAGTKSLIIDLRGNKGGDPAMEQLTVSFFVGPDEHLNDIYSRTDGSTHQYWSLPFLPGPRYPTNHSVFLLTDHDTVSAGEAFCYDLQQLKRAKVVGSVTAGGANPGGLVPIGPRFGLFVPTGRAINPVTKTNWEGVGVIPDVVVDPSSAYREANILALRDIARNATFADDRTAAKDALARAEANLPPAGPSPPPMNE